MKQTAWKMRKVELQTNIRSKGLFLNKELWWVFRREKRRRIGGGIHCLQQFVCVRLNFLRQSESALHINKSQLYSHVSLAVPLVWDFVLFHVAVRDIFHSKCRFDWSSSFPVIGWQMHVTPAHTTHQSRLSIEKRCPWRQNHLVFQPTN